MSKQYKLYEGFPTYKEVLKVYNDTVEKIKNITTIEQAKEYQNKNMITVEINGLLINDYVKNGGTDAEIEWIRYEEINQLAYVYCEMVNGKVDHIRFDVHCEWSDMEFIDSVTSLTQEQYYNEIEEHLKLFCNSEYKCIGYDTEELPELKFIS
jgi:hypothetical protein